MSVRLAVALSLLAVAATAGAAPTDPPTCTGTLAGAVTGEFACSVSATFDGQKVSFTIAPDGAVPGVASFAPATFEIPYPLRNQAYTLATLGSGASRLEVGGVAYVASGAQGEVTLQVESLERYPRPRPRYIVAGTLQARLVPARGAKGEVRMDVRF